jgi:hypothetical protein
MVLSFIKGSIPIGMRGHTANFFFNKIYFFGGYDGKLRNNDIYRLSLEDFSFTKYQNNKENIYPRQRHSATTTSDFKILFFGGFDGSRWLDNLDELNIYTLEQNISLQICQMSLKNNFKNLINNQEYSDIVFLVKDSYNNTQPIYAHKSILCTRCEYFRNMFSDHMIEKNLDELNIELFDYDVFLLFLEYLYTSDLSLKESYSMIKLYEVADAYSYEPLKNYCENVLGLLIEIDNVLDILILGYKLNSSALEHLAVNFICSHRKEVSYYCNLTILIDYPSLMIKILNNL